jgi:hypothetical protein
MKAQLRRRLFVLFLAFAVASFAGAGISRADGSSGPSDPGPGGCVTPVDPGGDGWILDELGVLLGCLA